MCLTRWACFLAAVMIPLTLIPRRADACTPIPPSGCETAKVVLETTRLPRNAPTIVYSGSIDSVALWSGQTSGASAVAFSAPDGGAVPFNTWSWPGAAVLQPTVPLELGAGYRLQVEEKCADGGWVSDGGVMLEFPVEVVADVAAPASVGTLRLLTPAPETVTRTREEFQANCESIVVEERVAQVRIRFTPDPSLTPWLSRTFFESSAGIEGLGSIGPGGREYVLQARCDDDAALGDHVFTLRAVVAGFGKESALEAELPYTLECSETPTEPLGCASAGSGSAAAVAALIACCAAFVRRRRHHSTEGSR